MNWVKPDVPLDREAPMRQRRAHHVHRITASGVTVFSCGMRSSALLTDAHVGRRCVVCQTRTAQEA